MSWIAQHNSGQLIDTLRPFRIHCENLRNSEEEKNQTLLKVGQRKTKFGVFWGFLFKCGQNPANGSTPLAWLDILHLLSKASPVPYMKICWVKILGINLAQNWLQVSKVNNQMSRFVVLFLFICLLLSVCLADGKRSTNNSTASASNWHLLNIKQSRKQRPCWFAQNRHALDKCRLHSVYFFGSFDWNDFPALVTIRRHNKLTNYSHKFLDTFIATKVAVPSLQLIVNFEDRQRNIWA